MARISSEMAKTHFPDAATTMDDSDGYTHEQIVSAVRSSIVTFEDFLADIEANVDDKKILMYIDRLLVNIYVSHIEGTTVSRTQACRMIPADHTDTCKKYVAEAERLGLVSFEADPSDGRRKNVKPTPELISYIEERARTALDTASAILSGKPIPRPLPMKRLKHLAVNH